VESLRLEVNDGLEVKLLFLFSVEAPQESHIASEEDPFSLLSLANAFVVLISEGQVGLVLSQDLTRSRTEVVGAAEVRVPRIDSAD